jgi:hypothetical protein
MHKYLLLLFMAIILAACGVKETPNTLESEVDGPIRLHPDNPHYFQYRGEALALITSAEHYGALINLDFDYQTYLKTLSKDGMNYTRIFTGTYFEIYGESFGIQKNTLAPKEGRVITPWMLIEVVENTKPLYDLSQWNEEYFKRLHAFMALAEELGVIVEVTLFSSIYRDAHWDICPQNPSNNVNLSESLDRFDAQTLNNGELLSFQMDYVKKMVQELNRYDNFFFEIQNEPWSDHTVPVYNIVNKEELKAEDWTFKADFADEASLDWQEHIASLIAEEESSLPKKHLIAQNYTNFRAPVPEVSDHISIINFHYAWPDAVRWNYHYNKVLGFDESGFAGSGDLVYRRQAWQFMLSGGGLFNHLDYSFFVGSEDGRGENQAPGGGSPALRSQLRILSEFLHDFDLPKLQPNAGCIVSSPGLIPFVLSDKNQSYAIFVRAIGTEEAILSLETGTGSYEVQTLNTLTGSYSDPLRIKADDVVLHVELEIPEGELALKISRI